MTTTAILNKSTRLAREPLVMATYDDSGQCILLQEITADGIVIREITTDDEGHFIRKEV